MTMAAANFSIGSTALAEVPMAWIRTGARRCIWVAIVGLAGFSGLTTASIVVEAVAATCGIGLNACDISAPQDPNIKLNSIDHFGSVSVGGVNSSFGHGDAQIDWFHNHFVLLAEEDTNT